MTEIDLPECPHKEDHTFKDEEQKWFGLFAFINAVRVKKWDTEDQMTVGTEDIAEIDEATDFADGEVDLVETSTDESIYQCGDCRRYFVLDHKGEELRWREVDYKKVSWRG